jgi:hypothetical protein
MFKIDALYIKRDFKIIQLDNINNIKSGDVIMSKNGENIIWKIMKELDEKNIEYSLGNYGDLIILSI